MRVIFNRLNASAAMPCYAHTSDSGADVQAIKGVVIQPGTLQRIPLGFSVELPEGYELQVRSRSGLAAKQSVFVLNSPGTIDCNYRGEIQVLLFNAGKEAVDIAPGMKVAQLVLSPVYRADYQIIDRGEGGFGSTDTAPAPTSVTGSSATMAPTMPATEPFPQSSSPSLILSDGDARGLVESLLSLN